MIRCSCAVVTRGPKKKMLQVQEKLLCGKRVIFQWPFSAPAGHHIVAVLTVFRKLHRTRLQVFDGDSHALDAGREKINSEFKANKDVADPAKIEELVGIAEDAERILRTSVVQGELVKPDTYELKIRPETALGDNTPFKPDAFIPLRRKKGKDRTESS